MESHEGNWKQFGGSVKEKWGKLTDDDPRSSMADVTS